MKRLIDAFEGLLTAAANSGGELARTANFTLENMNWTAKPGKPEPMSHPMVAKHLKAACANTGKQGSSTRGLAEALLPVADQLKWRASSKDPADGPDVALFIPNFAATTIIGAGGLLASDTVIAGFSLQGPDTYYPPHAHHAEESYWIIGGDGDWKVGTKPWFAVEPGDSIYHESGARHAMQTNEQALLTVWLWTSHLDSEVVIVSPDNSSRIRSLRSSWRNSLGDRSKKHSGSYGLRRIGRNVKSDAVQIRIGQTVTLKIAKTVCIPLI